ncbi:alpha-glucan phosphorylase [Methanohalobium evestigatum Z-7303]|uniref:Alpha-glucan phosphorylase n=1 Tax=Methanohalobium evestigatum (strain ATCC BAA-1072 / DSM 3721 / NBRC 107634 / OCM 161 / Z-7303) TaxID=644295 RepID=D7E8L6_METEZ|nr:alpha-glucan family phosphorylase [Methanohalobium evestigatum]ADI73687.1 alpha-glucan phosphorylase [Methanohalobium evestigatum Z-7303]
MDDLKGVFNEHKIAYFSMEIGLSNDIPTYAGGLGVLAGDTIRSSADLNLPIIALTLVSKKGFFNQHFDENGWQIESYEEWDPSKYAELLEPEINLKIENRNVKVKAWLYKYYSFTKEMIPILFLDTDFEENEPKDREITHYLYGGDEKYRLKQEIVLGMGGARMIDALELDIRKYHMNEGHSSLLTLELLHNYNMDGEKVRNLCVFTTHTPVKAGHDTFPYTLVEELFGDNEDIELLKKYSDSDKLDMTRLALNLSDYVNGVAKRHREISKQMFPGYEINTITNGVHTYNWTCSHFKQLYDEFVPGWAAEPELLVRASNIPYGRVWEAHNKAKKDLIDYVNEKTGKDMDYETLTIGFSRRAAEYKRHSFIFTDLERLKKVNYKGNLQFIFAGKAHPRDEAGKKIIQNIFGYIKELEGQIKIAYLEDYDMELASKMVSGVDIWLNTPMRPYEASGTSGMKAAHNGVINFSVLDGWWIEGWIEGVTGWSIGPKSYEYSSEDKIAKQEIDDFYNKLEYIIIPTYYERRNDWIKMMSNSISMIAYYFNTHRMMRRYVTEAYL